jgi:hypothetical protein
MESGPAPVPPSLAPADLEASGRSRLWARLGVDPATAFGLVTRVAQLAAAPVTLVLIARGFSPDVQGYYFTFASLLALQSFVELGFSIVVTSVASHEWAHLGLGAEGEVVGDLVARARLHALARLVARWYAAAAAVFALGVGAGGWVFLSRSSALAPAAWKGPWLAAVALSAALVWLTPMVSFLDGCDQYAVTNRYRLALSVLAALATWSAILAGAGLWTAVAAAAMNVSTMAVLVRLRYRRFFRSLSAVPARGQLHWASEIWPMQWRLALSGIVNYVAFSLFNPLMFAYRGAAVAGQMGMTLAAVRGIQLLGQSWIETKVAGFGALIARRQFAALDRLFYRRAAFSVGVTAAGGLALWTLVAALHATGHPLARRLLDPLPTALFAGAAVLTQASIAMSAYLRAHKRDPVMVVSIVSSLAIGGAVTLLGRRFGPTGAAAANMAVWTLTVVWQGRIWERCRREWHTGA